MRGRWGREGEVGREGASGEMGMRDREMEMRTGERRQDEIEYGWQNYSSLENDIFFLGKDSIFP